MNDSDTQEFLDALDPWEPQPDEWYIAYIHENTFTQCNYVFAYLSNGGGAFIPRSSDVITRNPVHLDSEHGYCEAADVYGKLRHRSPEG